MNVQDQMARVVRVQQIALQIRAAKTVVENAPARIEEIESRFRERNAEYVAVKERFEALEEDQRTRSSELKTLEENKKKYMEDLMQVQNQREYAAILKEIDAVKSHIAEHEEAILKDMEEIETVKTDLAKHEEHITEERKLVEQERSTVETETATAAKTIEIEEAERTKLQSELPRDLVASIDRIERGRQGQFLAKAEQGTCQSCFVRIRPQVFQEIKLATKIHTCGNCKRLLFFEPNFAVDTTQSERNAPESGPPAADSGSVEAMNEGAV